MDVKVGDNVFIIGIGWGQVSRLLPGSQGFFVKVGSTERQFSQNGTIGGSGAQKVFWQDPQIVIPCKDSKVWQSFIKIAKLLYTELQNLE
jgi:hypothetical protein